MKTPTWNDVENARDLHTGPQQDIPQPEAKLTDHVIAVLNRDMTDDETFRQAREQYRRVCDKNTAMLAALKLFVPAAAELERQSVIVSSRPGASESPLRNAATVCQLAIDNALAAIAQCEEGK